MSRADDMRILLEVLELESLNGYERDAFTSMLDDLRATQRELSAKQREWVANKLDVQIDVKPCGRKLRDLRHAHAELHAECIERDREEEAAREREQHERWVREQAEFKAGLRIRSDIRGGRLYVTGAPSYEMARAEAFAFVYSVRAAGGSARLRKHRSGGKTYLGRTEIRYYGGGNLGHHEGWSFPVEVAS